MITPSRKAKLLWHCRRGMLELDLILTRFAVTYLDRLSDEQVDAFDKLLTAIDPELYSWLMGYDHPMEKDLVDIVEFIKLHDKVR